MTFLPPSDFINFSFKDFHIKRSNDIYYQGLNFNRVISYTQLVMLVEVFIGVSSSGFPRIETSMLNYPIVSVPLVLISSSFSFLKVVAVLAGE